jgi:hypothetical protein
MVSTPQEGKAALAKATSETGMLEMDLTQMPPKSPSNESLTSSPQYLVVNGNKYYAVVFALLFLKMLTDYVSCAKNIPALPPEILNRIFDFLVLHLLTISKYWPPCLHFQNTGREPGVQVQQNVLSRLWGHLLVLAKLALGALFCCHRWSIELNLKMSSIPAFDEV